MGIRRGCSFRSPSHPTILLATQFALLDNYYDAGDVSGDGWNWDTQGHANDVTTKNVLVGYGNADFNIPFDWNGNPRNIGIALPNTTTGTPSPSTVRITTLFDPTGGSSIEPGTDRKSTRLNSSHLGISYAVFCLKKK